MRWYKIATMDITVADADIPKSADSIGSLAWKVSGELWKILQKALPPEEMKRFSSMQPTGIDFFTIDGLDSDATEGTLNLYVKNLPMEIIQKKLLPAISYFDKMYGGEITQPRFETYGEKLKQPGANPESIFPEGIPIEEAKAMANKVRVIRFRARIVPQQEIERPPALNLANDNCYFIFSKVLDFPTGLMGEPPWSFSVSDVLIKIQMQKNAFVMKARSEEENKQRQDWSPTKDKNIGGGAGPVWHDFQITPEYERVLGEIEKIALWAQQHDYSTIQVY